MNPDYFLAIVLIAGSTLLLLVIVLWFKLGRSNKKEKEEISFNTLFDQQPEAWLIIDGITLRTIKANQKAMNLFGIFREQFLNKLSFDKLFEEELSEDEVSLLLNAIDNNTFVNKTLVCRSLSGRNFKMSVSINRVSEGNLFCRFLEPLVMAIPMQHQVETAAIETTQKLQMNVPEIITAPEAATLTRRINASFRICRRWAYLFNIFLLLLRR